MRTFAAILLALTTLGLAGTAHAQTLSLDYKGAAYGVLKFGEAHIDLAVTGERYDARGRLDTAGLAVLFSNARARGHATGIVGAGALQPQTYELNHFYRGVMRDWLVDWSGPAVTVSTKPAFPATSETPPTEAQRRAGRDPLSTLLAMGVHITATGRCAGTFRVFDGLYVYDMTLTDKMAGRYQRGAIDLPAVRCGIRQKRIAGYATAADLAKTLPEGEIWFATPPGAPFAIMTRFSSSLPLGAAAIELTQVMVN